MSFGDWIALIKGDRPASSFTGIAGKKDKYVDDGSAEEGK